MSQQTELGSLLQADITRRRLLKSLGIGACAFTASGLIAACGGSSATGTAKTSNGNLTISGGGKPVHGGTMNFGGSGGANTDTLDAQDGLTNTDFARLAQLYDALVRMDSQGKPYLAMAESITPNKDASEWTVKLKPGIKCHDGSLFRASDILFSFNRILKNKFAGALTIGPMDIAQSRAIDARTAVLKFTRPYSIFLDALTLHWNLYMVPAGYNPKKPIGTGPFKLVSFTPGQSSTVTRFDDYYDQPKPYLDKVITTNINNETAQVNALQSNQVQAIDYLSAASIPTLQSGETSAKLIISKSGGMDPYTMRVDTPPFNDNRVRTAFKLILDRPQLLNSVFGGHGLIGNDIMSPFDPYCDPALFPQRVQDIEKAKSLLKAAGHSELATQLITLPEAPGMVQAAEVFATQAAPAGIKAAVVQQTATQYFAQSYLKVAFSQDYCQYMPYLVAASQFTITGAPYNETHQSVASYDKMWVEATSTTNLTLQREIAREMMRHDHEQSGQIIPFFFPVIDAVASNVYGVEPTVSGISLNSFNFGDMWMKA